jgi:hypothetical protein
MSLESTYGRLLVTITRNQVLPPLHRLAPRVLHVADTYQSDA